MLRLLLFPLYGGLRSLLRCEVGSYLFGRRFFSRLLLSLGLLCSDLFCDGLLRRVTGPLCGFRFCLCYLFRLFSGKPCLFCGPGFYGGFLLLGFFRTFRDEPSFLFLRKSCLLRRRRPRLFCSDLIQFALRQTGIEATRVLRQERIPSVPGTEMKRKLVVATDSILWVRLRSCNGWLCRHKRHVIAAQ